LKWKLSSLNRSNNHLKDLVIYFSEVRKNISFIVYFFVKQETTILGGPRTLCTPFLVKFRYQKYFSLHNFWLSNMKCSLTFSILLFCRSKMLPRPLVLSCVFILSSVFLHTCKYTFLGWGREKDETIKGILPIIMLKFWKDTKFVYIDFKVISSTEEQLFIPLLNISKVNSIMI
jgi:hypothetical protein